MLVSGYFCTAIFSYHYETPLEAPITIGAMIRQLFFSHILPPPANCTESVISHHVICCYNIFISRDENYAKFCIYITKHIFLCHHQTHRGLILCIFDVFVIWDTITNKKWHICSQNYKLSKLIIYCYLLKYHNILLACDTQRYTVVYLMRQYCFLVLLIVILLVW